MPELRICMNFDPLFLSITSALGATRTERPVFLSISVNPH
jgi:hypothetical protein